jgi:hypothetical protein
MKRQRSKSPLRLSRDADRLIALSTGLTASGSRAEDAFWEAGITRTVEKLLQAGNDNTLDTALDHTYQSNPGAHDVLVELIEAASESMVAEVDGQRWRILLLAVPLVACSRYSVPSGPISGEAMETIVPHLYGHVLAAAARACVSPYLYSIDQMPRDFSSVHKLAQKLGESAIAGSVPKLELTRLPETAPLLADTRFLLAGIAIVEGQPLFRWQEEEKVTRAVCLERWIAQCRPNLARLMPGCAFESLLPDAYFASCRESDRRVRPYAIRAAVGFLEDSLKVNASQLRAIVAGFGIDRVDEYRVGFTQRGQEDVLHGIVWPLYGREDDEAQPTPVKEVEDALKEAKVGEVTRLSGIFAPEFCEDCGAPLFADADAEMVHPEMPEEAEPTAAHYH